MNEWNPIIVALIARRQELKVSQYELAARMKTSQSHISDLENHRYRPGLDTINKWAEALDMSVAVVLKKKVEVARVEAVVEEKS